MTKVRFLLAPPAGLEPATPWLTVRCSTDWAKEEYEVLFSPRQVLNLLCKYIRIADFPTWAKEEYEENEGKLIQFPLGLCRLWAIFPGRRQPSIFTTAALNFRVRNGNGWTHCVKNTDSGMVSFCSDSIPTIPSGMNYGISTELPRVVKPACGRLVHLRGLEPRTHWLRVSCSTSWARGADPGLGAMNFILRLTFIENRIKVKVLSQAKLTIIESWTMKFKPSVY